ncbi:TonB-dependent receptor [Flavisolibacter sp. BT320]|nr:TonB-dependent receptor [Flavisolibacter longurius]
MSYLVRVLAVVLFLLAVPTLFAQKTVKGKIIDAVTKEPISGATIQCSGADCQCGCATSATGDFEMHCRNCKTLTVSFIGYQPQIISVEADNSLVALVPAASLLNEVVISSSRQPVRRAEAPVAIATISTKTIMDAKPTTVDQVLNKVSGVYMVNLGNEQHQMSIRQPMTTKGLFLYLEDGIPLRTTGLFNHNALLEMNMAAVKTIEVIKGPSSSLYGSEAIGGVVNFIMASPTAVPVAKLSAQANSLGYTRTDLQSSATSGKFGVAVSGYYAQRRNGFIEYSDFTKATFTVRMNYAISQATTLANSLTWMQYRSDMGGSIDSSRFANRSFTSQQTFTYRNVDALRYRSTLSHSWNEKSKSAVSLVYRDNSIAQNPAYGIKNDYRRVSSGAWTGNKALAHGEINSSTFNSYAIVAQHKQAFAWKNAVVIGGISADFSPSLYRANYIRIQVDSVRNKYIGYSEADSVLTYYKNGVNNYAAFANVEFSPVKTLRIVASLRYDLFRYNFDNYLKPSSFSGSADTVNTFYAVSPKLGFTYNFSSRTGLYVNYSQGFVPPQVTEMYRGVRVPTLAPSVFHNYEMGGWAEIIKNRLSGDISIYELRGTNEIVSVRLDDGSTENRNTGKTLHRGIELGLQATPVKDLSVRFTGAYSQHRFTAFVEKGIDYGGKEMNGAPAWMHNAEVWYKPSFVKGLRIGAEWQKLGAYFMDPANTTTYEGFNALHLRAGYQWKATELWVNVLNATNQYYAFAASRSNSGYSYTPAEPRNITVGVAFDFGKLIKN